MEVSTSLRTRLRGGIIVLFVFVVFVFFKPRDWGEKLEVLLQKRKVVRPRVSQS